MTTAAMMQSIHLLKIRSEIGGLWWGHAIQRRLSTDSVEKLFFHRPWKNFSRYRMRRALQAGRIRGRRDVAM